MEDIDVAHYKRLEQENKRLRKVVDELAILNDLARDIGGSRDSDQIMRTVISRSIRSIGAEQGDITLVENNEADPTRTLVRSMVSSMDRTPLHLNQHLLGWMQINRKPLIINEPRADERFRHVDWDPNIRSVLSAPLMVKSQLIGTLTMYNNRHKTGFTDDDKRMLSIIASQSAQIVESARLYEEEQELIAMRNELAVAATIQRVLLPGSPPDIPGYSICGKNITAREVGGDLYDFIKIDDQRWAITLGDVSGKGLPASLLMSNLQATLRGQALHDMPTGRLLTYANELLYRSTSPEKFATVFFAILDISEHTLAYSNAGHEFPFLIRNADSAERLNEGGIPLGLFATYVYPDARTIIEPGDRLIIYSDGVTDNADRNGNPFGEDRLEHLLRESTEIKSAQHLMEKVIDHSTIHAESQQLFDDLTVVALCRKPD